MRGPRGSLGYYLAHCYLPTGTPGTIDSGNKPEDFPVNPGATYWVLKAKLTQQSPPSMAVTRVSGKPPLQASLKPLECRLGDLKLRHNFLHMPDCPIPLLGWDLPCKLDAQMTFFPKKQQLHL